MCACRENAVQVHVPEAAQIVMKHWASFAFEEHSMSINLLADTRFTKAVSKVDLRKEHYDGKRSHPRMLPGLHPLYTCLIRHSYVFLFCCFCAVTHRPGAAWAIAKVHYFDEWRRDTDRWKETRTDPSQVSQQAMLAGAQTFADNVRGFVEAVFEAMPAPELTIGVKLPSNPKNKTRVNALKAHSSSVRSGVSRSAALVGAHGLAMWGRSDEDWRLCPIESADWGVLLEFEVGFAVLHTFVDLR